MKAIYAQYFCQQPASSKDAQSESALTSLECFVHIQLRAMQYWRSNRLQKIAQPRGSLPDLGMLLLLCARLQQKQVLLTQTALQVCAALTNEHHDYISHASQADLQEHTSVLAETSRLDREAFISCNLDRCRDLMLVGDGGASCALCLSPEQVSTCG